MRRLFTFAIVLILGFAFGVTAFHHHPVDGDCSICKAFGAPAARTEKVRAEGTLLVSGPLPAPAVQIVPGPTAYTHFRLRAPPTV